MWTGARAHVAAATLLLLVLAQLTGPVSAHGNDSHDNGENGHGHGHGQMAGMHMATGTVGAAAEAAPPTSTAPPSYFALEEHAGLMYAHIAFMTLAWAFVLPIGVMLSLARSRGALFVEIAFLVLHGLGVVVGSVYKANTPDRYSGNAHKPLGWVLTWLAALQALLTLLRLYARKSPAHELNDYMPVSVENMSEHTRHHHHDAGYRWSGDSGQGTELDDEEAEREPFTRDYEARDVEQGSWAKGMFARLDQHFSRHLHLGGSWWSNRAVRTARLASAIIDRLILPLGFVAYTTGAVVYGGIFRDRDIFNGLAHFIKGGIFFWYGLLTLGRWMGCFADLGWAWNVKPPASIVGRSKARMPSAEFVESFVIFFYGASNVFLEHLASWGKQWSPMDLEHVSISIMFFGGGLAGMMVESKRVRELLNAGIAQRRHRSWGQSGDDGKEAAWRSPVQYGVSLNPIPGLVILLLGLMMSSHHQDSMVSSMVHKQWGMLLVGFALARGVTYILLYLSPPSSYLPSRPPSELVAAFCLIAGGLVFMASNRNTVQAIEGYGLDAMFVFTVVMGFTAFLMAWCVGVMAVKGWASGKSVAA